MISLFYWLQLLQFALAGPAAPSPVCLAKFKVQEVVPIKETLCEFGHPPHPVAAHVRAKIKILTVEEVHSKSGDSLEACSQTYQVNSEVMAIIGRKDEPKFRVGQVYSRKIHFSGDECQNGVFILTP